MPYGAERSGCRLRRRGHLGLRDILPQKRVGVLVGAALPGCVWIGKEDARADRPRQARMTSHLLALVICPGLAQGPGGIVFSAPAPALVAT